MSSLPKWLGSCLCNSPTIVNLNHLKSCPNSTQELLCFKRKTFRHRNQFCNFVS